MITFARLCCVVPLNSGMQVIGFIVKLSIRSLGQVPTFDRPLDIAKYQKLNPHVFSADSQLPAGLLKCTLTSVKQREETWPARRGERIVSCCGVVKAAPC